MKRTGDGHRRVGIWHELVGGKGRKGAMVVGRKLIHLITICMLVISMLGNSVSAVLAAPNPQWVEPAWDFGPVYIGSFSTAKTFELRNTGADPFTINTDAQVNTLSLPIAGPGNFRASANACRAGLQVNTGQACTIDVQFQPMGTGQTLGEISVEIAGYVDPFTVSLEGVGVNTQLLLNPGSLNFANQLVGVESPTKTVTATNSSSGPITISTVQTTNLLPFAIRSNGCNNQTLTQNQSCQVTVSFTPQATGPAPAAELTFTSTAPPTSQQIPLTGTGISPLPTLSPSSLDFGNVAVGTTSSIQTFTLINTTEFPVDIATLPATFDADFAVFSACFSTATFPVTMLPGQTCTIDVTFVPSLPGVIGGSLSFDVVVGSNTYTMSGGFFGVGTVGSLTINPSTVNFGSVLNGQKSAAQMVTITNIGGGDATITGNINTADFNGGDPAAFEVIASGCPNGTLAAGASCNVTLRFAPNGLGNLSSALQIPTSSGTLQTTVNGTGVAAPVTAPVLSVTPGALSFGSVQENQPSAAQAVTIANTGTANLSITGLNIVGGNAGNFSVSADNCTSTLAPGTSCTVAIRFTPNTTGSRTSSYQIATNAGNALVLLNGVGTATPPAPAPLLIVTPAALNFGAVTQGQSSAGQVVTITNAGTATMNLTSFAAVGGDASDFNPPVGSTCGTTLAAGASCEVTIRFTPGGGGNRASTLQVITGNAGSHLVALNGVRVAPTAIIAPTTVDFGQVQQGQVSAGVPVTITNTSDAPIGLPGTIDTATNIVGGNNGDFDVLTEGCPVSLPAGASCTILVQFGPGSSTTGNRTSTLSVVTVAGTLVATLNGEATATPPTAPALSFSPAVLNFGSQQVNVASNPLFVTVTNTGTANVVFGGAPTIAGGSAVDFGVVNNACPTTLTPGSSCTISVDFEPNAAGLRTSALVFTDNVPATGSTQIVTLVGTGVAAPTTAAGISINPSALSFGNQTLSVARVQTLTVTNTGTAPLIISSVVPAGGNTADFGISGDTCTTVASIAPNSTCVIGVVFTPQALGNRASSLLFTDNAPIGSSTQVVPLNGVGVAAAAPVATVSPASVDFGDVQVSTVSGAQAITLTNTGAGVLTLSNNPDVVGTDSAMFAIVYNGCSATTLSAGASCTVTVRFAPNITGAKSAALRFRTDASGSPHIVNLTGNSVAAPVTAPAASLSVGALSFGDQLVNTRSGAQAVTITNTGTATLTLSPQPTLFGGDASQFEIVADGCWAGSGSLAPGASCTVTVRFFPGSAGQKSTALRFGSNASGSPHLVNLTGNGVTLPPTAPGIAFNPAAVAFGTQTVGTLSGTRTVVVTNTGTANLTIASVARAAGAEAADFPNLATNCGTLTPGAQCIITLGFAPSAVGNRATTIVVVADAPSAGSTHVIPVSGVGVAPGTPSIAVNPQSIDFGDHVVTEPSGAQAITVTNTGSGNLTFSAAPALIGANAGSFALVADGCATTTLTPGSSCTVTVRFSTSTVGNKNAALAFYSNVSGSPHLVNLTGNGVAAPVTAPFASLSTATLSFGDVVVNTQSAAQEVRITNTGNANLILSAAPSIGGADAAQFQIVTDGCGATTLTPNASCTVTVRFFPGSVGQKSASLVFASNISGTYSIVNLIGNGIAAGVPAIEIDPSVIAFGDVAVGSSAVRTVTVTNTGTAPLVFTTVDVVGTAYTESGDTCQNATLQPGGTCQIAVVFRPTATGAQTGTLTFNDNAPTTGSLQVIGLSGTGTSNVLTFAPAPLDFGNVAVGGVAQRSILVTNTGGGPVTITAVGGPSGELSIPSSTCVNATLEPGASCVVVVQYGPANTGVDTDTIDFTVSGVAGIVSTAVIGNGVATPTPTLSVSPAVVNFGNVPVNTSAAQTVTVTNTGNAPLVISGFSNSAAPFTISGNGCVNGATLNPGQSCSFAVTFAPTAPGADSDAVAITSNASGSPIAISFSGFGVSSVLSFTPPPVNFGEVPVGSGSTLGLLVTNQGGGPITITGNTGLAAPFSIVGDGCSGLTLAPGASCVLDLKFQPAGVGYVFDTLDVITSLGNFGTVLDGTGTSTPLGVVTIDPGAIAFGQVPVGTTATETVTVTNTGNADLTLGVLSIPVGAFALSGNGCNNQTLTPRQSCTFNVVYTPTAGANTGSVTVPTSVGSPTVALSGTGVSSVLSFTPTPLNFGNVAIGSTSALGIVVTNTGSGPVTIAEVAELFIAGDIRLFSTTCFALTLAAGESCAVSVIFAPTGLGPASDQLYFDASAGAPVTVVGIAGITGNGVAAPAPALSLSPSVLNFGVVSVGATPSQTVTITNTGSANFTLGNPAITGVPGPYAISGAGCNGAILTPGQSCSFTVTFTPAAPGLVALNLSVASNAPGNPHTLGLIGTAVNNVLNFTPNPLDFGDVAIGTTATRGVLVANTGSGPVTITAVGGLGGDFLLDSTTCVTTLGPGASCTVAVRYTPTAPAGPDNSQINLTVSGVGGFVSSSVRGNGVATPLPAVSFSPAVVNFGNVPLATSVAQTVTYTNTGNAPLVISAIAATGAPFTISGNGCTAGVTLDPGESCSFAVTFVPAGVGPANGSVAITSNVPGGPHAISFSGFGVSSVIAFTPPPVNFGEVPIGSGSTLGVLVTNMGGGPVSITSATVPVGPFSIVGDTCGTLTLAPGASCVLDVKFQPLGPAGYAFATLTLATSAGNFTTVLDGTAVVAPSPAFTISPAVVNFGLVPVGTTPSQTVTITNTGTANFSVTSFTGPAAPFSVSGVGCVGATLTPGQSCTFSVTFAPTVTGPDSDTISILTSISATPFTLNLTGAGVSSVLSFTPSPLDFGNVAIGTSSTLGLTATNTGSGPVTITLVGGLGGDFSLQSTTCVTTLAPGASCAVVVTYTPTAPPGADSDTVDFTVTGAGTVSASVVGNGVTAPVPTVTIQPTSLNFGDVQVNTTSPALPLTVTNTGNAPLNITTLGTSSAAFGLTANGCAGATLLPGESCTVGVTFTPAAAGQTAGTLQINDNAGGVLTAQFVSLTGNGISAGLAVTPGSLDFGNVQIGTTSAVQAVTVTNVGLGTITINTVPASANFSTFADTCTNQTLASGESCTVGVRFTPPPTPGQTTGTLTINSSGPDPVVSLVGVGIPAQLSVTPASLDFGVRQLGTASAAQTITVKNVGSGPVTITATTLPAFANFEIVGNTCQPGGNDVTLAAGQECTISVRFTPTGLGGDKSSLLTITSNAPVAASAVTVGLYGIATTAAINVVPSSLDFGDQQIGTTSVSKTITVTNVGDGPVGFLTPTINGNFDIFFNTCLLASLAPGDSCTVGVVFEPVAPGGPKTGTLTLLDTASGSHQVSLTGNAISAQLSVTPASIDFGNQTVNTQSVSQTVTVKNVGSGPVTITATQPFGGTNVGDFSIVADTCQPGGNDLTLAAGQECTISVLFQPQATGARNAQLIITSNAPITGSTVAVSLLGFGVTSGPAIGLSSSSLDFGSIPVNTSATRTITVTNNGTAPLIFNASGPAGVVLAGDAAYTLTGNTCNGVTLLPGETCTVGVTFTPTTLGATAATTLSFASNAPGSPHTVNVTGIGTSAVFTFDPAALNFGAAQVNTTATLTTLVTNRTGGPARITAISGVTNPPFTLVGDSCTNVLLPDGASCALTFNFTPTAVQYYSASVTLNLSTGGTITLALTGNGVAAPTPLLSITPASLDFGYVQTGQQAPAQTVTITNVGAIDASIGTVAVSSGGAFFAESADTCSDQVLRPGQECTYSVIFVPGTTTGPISGAVTVTSNAPSSTHIVPLFGNGITAGLSIAPASLNFGNVQVGTASAAQTVTVTNTGSGPVNITNFGLIDADASQYEVVDNTCITAGFPATLAPGASCTFAVRFKPTTAGAKGAARLSLTSSAAGNPQTVGLYGVGVTPAFNLSANGLDFGNIVVGQTSATQTVTLTNSTNGPLTISGVGATAGTYLVTGDTCSGQTIPAGASCQIGVQFRPAAVGPDNEALVINYANGQGGTVAVIVSLTGNGISGAVNISPNALNFGYQQVGTTSAAQVVTISGNPNGPVQIISASVLNGTHFAETGDTCQGQTVSPNGSCTVGVTFTPASPGAKSDTLRIVYNAGSGNQTVDIQLSGIGVSPALGLSANGLDFGYQQVNTSSAVQTITVTNSTNGPLTLVNPVIVGGPNFVESGDTCNGLTLAPNQTCTIGVIFRPTTTGPLTDTLRIRYADGQGNNVDVPVTLTGIGITAQVSVTPASLDFGNLQLGSTSPAQTVTVKNVGSGPVNITGTTIAGPYSIVANTCFTAGNGATLPAGAECTLSVVFQPTTPAGVKTGTLTITDSASGTPQVVSLTGVGITPAIEVTPASLSFGPQQIGIDSPAQLITVRNIGTGPVNVGSIFAAAYPPFRVVDNQCSGQLLAVNQTCTFAVVFNSPVAGTVNGTVSITTDAPTAATVTTVTLVGMATNATLYVSTPTVDFGTVQVGTTAGPKTVTLTNVGSGPILIASGPSLGGTNPGDFAHSNGCTGATLLPGQSCTIEITFTPTAVGARTATITVTDNASGNPQVITLTGVGINPGFTLSATGLDFGYQQVGTASQAQTVRLTNNSTGPLTVSTVGLVTNTQYVITGENCSNRTFGPGQSCEIGVVFRPTAAGQQNDTLQVVYNNGVTNVTLGVVLTGIGTTAQVSVTPASLDFGYVQVGVTTAARTVTVTNIGSGPVTISGASIIAGGTDFVAVGNTCFTAGNGATLPPGGTCTISVVFTPTQQGSRLGTLRITDSASGTPQDVQLTGTGISANISIAPSALDFGYQQVGTTSASQTITVTNIGSGPVSISNFVETDALGQFNVVGNTCYSASLGANLPPGATCQITVTFSPTTPGLKTATLSISDNASGTTQLISLQGTGITAQLSISPASLDFGVVQVGSATPAQVVTVTNVGSGPVTFNLSGILGADATQFEVLANTCFSAGNPATLPPGESCTIAVRFIPTSVGYKSALLAIVDTASGTPHTVALSGVAVTQALSVSPASLSFGPQQINITSPAKAVTITNTTGAPVTIGAILPSTFPPFAIVDNLCTGTTLGPNATCTFSVVFNSATAGTFNGVVTIVSNHPAPLTLTTISLTGVATNPSMEISPASLDFGNVQVGTTSPAQTVTIKNNGYGPLTINTTTLPGPDGAHFQIVDDGCQGQVIPAGQTCQISVRFTPTTAGAKTAQLRVTSDAATSPQTIGLTGVGITAQVSISPASLDFGNVQTGAVSPARTVTLTNTGSGPVTITATTLGGTNAGDFEVLANTCFSAGNGAMLAAGATCTISVRFTPGSNGAKSATLRIGDSASGTPQVVGLSGVGISAAISLNPASLDFGNVQVGTTSPAKTVTITNTSAGPLSIASIVSNSGEFQVVGNTCGNQTIAPNATCTVSVIFAPLTPGAKAATLTITDSTNTGSHIVSLTGTGITGGLSFNPVAINFGNQQINTTATQAIVVTNVSSGPVTISAVSLGSGTSSAFSLTANTCVGATLPAGASCAVGVNFSPATVGQHTGSVVFIDTAAGSPHVVTLSGQGIGTPTPVVEITPASLDFGNQQVGTTSPAKTVTIKNNGTAALTISSVLVSVGAADFTKVADTCSGQTVNPGQSCTVSVVFNPTVGGPRAGLLTITDNVPTAGSIQTVSLTGTGVTGALTVSPTALDFGNIQVGTTSPAQTLTIQNTGAATFTINSVTINSSEFIVTGSSCAGVTLAAGEICQIGVVFKPTSAGPKNATMTINHTAPGSPTTVNLAGNGISAAISLAPASLDFGPQQVNTSSPAQTVTIRNVSNGPLQISTIVSDNPEFQVFANTCASQTIAPDATCTVSVVFRPSVTGQRTGTLTINDNTATGSHTVSLTGMGVTSAVTLSDGNFQFGSQQVGTTSPAKTLTLRNTGENTLTISSVVIDGTNSIDFIKSGDTCLGATLAPGQECQVSVSFSPTAGGSRSATLRITDSAPGSPRTVVLGGIGITPAVTFAPLSLDFGQVAVGATSAAQTVTITNTSDGPLTILSVLSTNAAFVTGADTCSLATLPQGGTCQVSVTFRPTATGQQSGSLVFNTTVGSGQQSISLTGLGVAAATPTIGLSATTLSFGTQQVGTQSVTQMLTLTNTGNVPVTISAVVLNGANSTDFILYGNSCVGATIAAGGTCQIGVAFKPSAVGSRSGTLRIEDSAAGSPRSVALLGIGLAPTLTVSAPSLEFGSVQVGATSGPQTVTLTNNSTGPVTIGTVMVTGQNNTEFTKSLDTCAQTTLAPQASCSITVRFSPQAGGSRSGGVLVTITGGNALTIGLNGLGVTGQVSFEPSALNFGTQPLTTMSNFQTVRLTNGGTGSLSITSVSLTNGDTTDFVIAGDTCSGGTLGPNGSCQVNVAFKPTATGNRFARLTFATNVGSGFQAVPVQGVGTTTPTPAIQLSVQGLTFEPQQVGTQSGIQSITVTNTGTANLSLASVTINGTNGSDFLKTGDNCAATSLAPGASCSLGVRFAPSASGNRTGTLTFATNAGTGSQSISLVGIGVTPTVHLSANSLQFGQQPVGVSSTGKTLELTNTGNGALTISSVVLAGINAGDFLKNGDTCAGATLAPGLSCTIGVIFRPLSVGNKTGALLINDSAPGSPREIVLMGEGVQVLTPSVGLSANSLDFGTVQVGSVSTGQSLIITNTGAANLRITSLVLFGNNSTDFVKTGDTCSNGTLAPQNFCSVGVIFRPTAAGVRLGSLMLVDDAAGSPREITLTGVGLTGAVGLSAASLEFGGQTIGIQSGTKTLTVTNTGQGALTLGAVAVAGPNAADWILLANTCVNATVPSGSSCQIGVAFKPTAEGDRSATLTIANTAAGSVHNVALLGTGLLPQPRYTVTLNVSTLGCNGIITPSGGVYEAGTEVELRIDTGSAFVFLGWRINGLAAGWANPLTLTVTRNMTVEAVCTPKEPFTDTAGNPYLQAIYELTARGVIRGYGDGRFGPNDTTQRAQMAALIARAMGWDTEDRGNPFVDQNGNDPNLWRNVGTLAYYGVAFGYDPTHFAPNDNVTRAQTISFITRAMVVKGYWQRQPDNPALFPDVPASSGHRIDLVTYYYYVGSIPETNGSASFPGWSQPATRSWFSETLWRALNGYFGRDQDGLGGFVP